MALATLSIPWLMAAGTSSEEGAGIIKHMWDNLLLIPLESLI